MKVVAFNGSARKSGNTAILIEYVLAELEHAGIQTELIELAGKTINGCTACMKCHDNKDRSCAVKDDYANECIEKMIEAQGIVLGSPTYFTNVTPIMKALIDRAGMVAKANEDMFQRKVGAAVVAVRRGGALHTFDSLNHFFQIGQMIIPGSCYWNMGVGFEPGEVQSDQEGIQTMKTLGHNMAWLLKRLYTE